MKRFLLVLSLLSFGPVFSQVNLTTSLSACYALDGNGNDAANGLTATLSAVTATVDRFNNSNSAYRLSGSASSYIELPNSPLLKANAVSFSAWVKFNVVGSYLVFAHNGCGSYFEGYSFGASNSILQIAKANTCSQSAQIILYGTTNITAGTWYHVGFYAGPDSLKIYVNGLLDNSMANSNPIVYNPNSKVYLGGTNISPNAPFNGCFDNVRFYNRKLSNAEVNALYTVDPICAVSPVTSFSASPVNFCAGGSVALTDLSTNSPTAWNWQVAGAATATASVSNPTLTLNTPGNYTVSLVASNSTGAGNTFTQAITVKSNPTVSISSNNIFCTGQTNTLVASGASTYQWNAGPGTAALVISPTQNTTYTVTGTASNGCSATAQQNVVVNTPPSLSISGNTIVCQGSSTSLLVNGNAATYLWSTSFAGNLVTVSPGVSTVYTVVGTAVNGCTNTASQLVFVNTLPAVTVNNASVSICLGDAAQLSAMGAITYSWSGGVVNNSSFFPSTTAVYTVTGTGSNGCKNSATAQVIVNPLPALTHTTSAPSNVCAGTSISLFVSGANIYAWSTGDVLPSITVTPTVTTNYTVTGSDVNGCKSSFVFNQIVDACTGIDAYMVDSRLVVYPNPVNEQVMVKFSSFGPASFSLTDLLGRILIQEEWNDAQYRQVDMTSFPKGIYFIKLAGPGRNESVKIFKE